jgi:alkylation response protein AidB-like acyl-CoA dehydrogenase
MDFSLDEQQTMLRDSVKGYLDRSYGFEKRRALIHESGSFDSDHWRAFAEMGWLGASLPEEVGGSGGGAEEAAIIVGEMGGALVVEPFVAVAILAAQTLLHSGGDNAHRLCAEIASGEGRPVLAHNETGARGDVAFVETRAGPIGERHRLNGIKSLVLGGPNATAFLVSARHEGGVGELDGVSLFLVSPDAPGLSRRDVRLVDGSRASELVLRDVELPDSARIGTVGAALPAIATGHAHATVALCSEALGAMDRALWITRDYLQTRRQFGQPISSFQALQHRMADMLVELELSRSAVYRALAYLDSPPARRDHAVSVAKAQIGKACKFVGGQAIQLHGGIGVTEEYIIGHYFKRLTLIDNMFGTVQMHLARIAALGRADDGGSTFN